MKNVGPDIYARVWTKPKDYENLREFFFFFFPYTILVDMLGSNF